MSAWVRDYEHGLDYIEHLDGVGWYDAPRPRRFHTCRAQTRGLMRCDYIERCACGAINILGGWIHKNERRKGRR